MPSPRVRVRIQTVLFALACVGMALATSACDWINVGGPY
jgi:hypothetical protein